MRRHLLLVLAPVVAIALGALAWYFIRMPANAALDPAQIAATQAAASQAIPVTAGVAKTDDVPVYRTGLGTVQAYNTVTVKVRVDGQLNTVTFTEGQDVKANDVLAQIDPRSFRATLDQANAAKAKDEAQLANAKLDLQRFVNLGEFATKQSVDTQTALVRQLEATVLADAAAVESAQVQLDYTTITAPLSGRTGLRLVDPGNIVHVTDPNGLVVITQLQPISVIFTLPQDQLPEVMKGSASGALKAIATARTNGQALGEGTLALVDNQIDPNTGTVRLKATFPNEDYALWPGQFVNVRLLVRSLQNVVTVPSSAVQRGPDGTYVYVVNSDSTVAMQAVTVTEMIDGSSVITTGLDAGARIVVSGQYRLQPGSRVQAGAATAESSGGT
ncbi:MAG: rane fusion protein multidrug efflux system [Alphaproteobacteria bacterium]|nr:rane fusion protein multidrug efflux system [Alphaproteobacteria bacterium]